MMLMIGDVAEGTTLWTELSLPEKRLLAAYLTLLRVQLGVLRTALRVARRNGLETSPKSISLLCDNVYDDVCDVMLMLFPDGL